MGVTCCSIEHDSVITVNTSAGETFAGIIGKEGGEKTFVKGGTSYFDYSAPTENTSRTTNNNTNTNLDGSNNNTQVYEPKSSDGEIRQSNKDEKIGEMLVENPFKSSSSARGSKFDSDRELTVEEIMKKKEDKEKKKRDSIKNLKIIQEHTPDNIKNAMQRISLQSQFHLNSKMK